MKPHKHAELIKAWADGAEIEIWSCNDWWLETEPTWNPKDKYRIKPEPKPDVVATGIIEWNGKVIGERKVADYGTEFRVSEHYEKNNIKLTFDGETGELKSAEVLK